MSKTPFKMKGWSSFTKASPAKAGDYVATAADPKKQSFVDKAFRAKNDAISKLMSKHGISKSKAIQIYDENIKK